MLLHEIFSVSSSGITSTIHEHSVLIVAWMRLSSEYRFTEYDAVLVLDLSPPQVSYIVVDDRLIRISVISLEELAKS